MGGRAAGWLEAEDSGVALGEVGRGKIAVELVHHSHGRGEACDGVGVVFEDFPARG